MLLTHWSVRQKLNCVRSVQLRRSVVCTHLKVLCYCDNVKFNGKTHKWFGTLWNVIMGLMERNNYRLVSSYKQGFNAVPSQRSRFSW